MNIDNETLLDLVGEEDFHDISVVKDIAKKVFLSKDFELVRMFLGKLRFSFLSNDEGYRTRVLEILTDLTADLSLELLFSACFDTLVGNYLVLLVLLKQYPVISFENVRNVLEIVPRLEWLEDVYLFSFPYQGQVLLQIDERVRTLRQEEVRKLERSCSILLEMGFFHMSEPTIKSFQQIYYAMDKPEYQLRAELISSLIKEDFDRFSLVVKKFGGLELESEEDIVFKYFDLWKYLEKLSLPVYFDVRNLRYNKVLYNGNFYFLRYLDFEGKENVIYPFSQVQLSDVNKVYDPKAETFFTPRERYGRLLLSDICSFREVKTIGDLDHKSITAVTSMDEDEIKKGIRHILKDANLTSHSPVELADVLTLNLFVNNSDDLRLSGFIIKGQSFGSLHLNDIAGQLLQVSLSPIEIVFLVHVPTIDDRALRMFIETCESRQKNYCVMDRNDLVRLFMAHKIL